MNDACGMCLRQRVGDLDGILQGFIQPQPLAADQLAQRFTCDILHRNELDPVRFRDVVNVNDIGVVQCGSRLGLQHESALAFRVSQSFDGERFQRDKPVEVGTPRLPHHTHAALAQLFGDLILHQNLTDHGDLR